MQVEIPKLLDDKYIFPNPQEATNEGLLAWGGDLDPSRLLRAYREGIFPWYNQNDPILWWSPNPRLVLFPDEFKISKSLKASRKKFEIRYNTDFEKVILTCKKMRAHTWISDEMLEAYIKLHKLGIAKSIECYQNDELVGGLYGLLMGSVFCGESMFSKVSDASKVALWNLCERMRENGGEFIDCQMPTEHLMSLGAVTVSRDDFIKMLQQGREKRIDL